MFFRGNVLAQSGPERDSATKGYYSWQADPSLFLEPNRFSVVKELSDRSLWLQLGFGQALLAAGALQIGLEGMAWSRLRILSDFRFPVETADYFFGAFFVLPTNEDHVGWRFRISHISSHDVDGKDSILAGSSSHYSREFIELTRESALTDDIYFTFGLRGYFHQVTKFEPWIAVPAALTWQFARISSRQKEYLDRSTQINSGYVFYAFVSSGDGPVWPTISTGIRADHTSLGTLGLQLYYQYGASWAGTDAGIKRSTVNLQMDVRGF